MDKAYEINNETELAEVIGEPLDLIQMKVFSRLDGSMREYIGASPLVFVATLDAAGRPDVSPKGDPAGFVTIDDSGNLIIPERPGNRLTFGFKNILRDNQIGLIFVVPGFRETLRVKGRASLHRDPDIIESLAVNGKPALMYTYIEVEECFFHCGKAMIRSKTWKPETWRSIDGALMARQLTSVLAGDEEVEKMVAAEIEKNYEEELY